MSDGQQQIYLYNYAFNQDYVCVVRIILPPFSPLYLVLLFRRHFCRFPNVHSFPVFVRSESAAGQH